MLFVIPLVMILNVVIVQAETCVEGTGGSEACTSYSSGQTFDVTIKWQATGGGGNVNWVGIFDTSDATCASKPVAGSKSNICFSGQTSETINVPTGGPYYYKVCQAWCVRKDACSGCGWDTVIYDGGPIILQGCYDKNDTYEYFGPLSRKDFGYYYDENITKYKNADSSSGACSCISPSSWNTNASCCGDDINDCGRVASGQLCNINSANTTAAWLSASPNAGDIRYAGCDNSEFLSNGKTWTKCFGNFWNMTVNNSEYVCADVGRESIAECCGNETCNSVTDGKRLLTGQSVNASYPSSYNPVAYQSAINKSALSNISNLITGSAVYGGLLPITGRDISNPRICGDNFCEPGLFEDCASCPQDCGACSVASIVASILGTGTANATCKNGAPSIVLEWDTCAGLADEWTIFAIGKRYNVSQNNLTNINTNLTQYNLTNFTKYNLSLDLSKYLREVFNISSYNLTNLTKYNTTSLTLYKYNLTGKGKCKDSITWSASVPRQISGASSELVAPENFYTYAWYITLLKNYSSPQAYGILNTPNCTTGGAALVDLVGDITEVSSCGNKICEQGEDHSSCPADCEATVNGTLYCTPDNKFAIDLDTPNSKVNNTQLNSRNKKTCEAAGFKWTGTKCCSEADDNLNSQREYYNDHNGTGGCWKSKLVASIDFVNGTNDSVINYNGEFHGCAINKSNFVINDTYLLNITDIHTQKQLITDNSYCTNDIDNNYFCSYTEKWLPSYGDNKTHLSFAPVVNATQAAECCTPDECWSGASCIVNQKSSPLEGSTSGFRCIDGNWTSAVLKFTPDRQNDGYCPSDPQCLLDPYAALPQQQCIGSGEYYNDSYCENGNWSSRTKLLALNLLNMRSSANYTLFCDEYNNTLNSLKYITNSNTSSNLVSNTLKQSLGVNNFCVLKDGSDVIVGVSINNNITEAINDTLNLFNVTSCSNSSLAADGLYHSCDATNKLWVNSKLNSIIYSNVSIAVPLNKDILGLFKELIGQPIQNIIDAVQRLIQNPPAGSSYTTAFSKFDRIFFNQQGGKAITGAIEWRTKNSVKNAVIEYKNLTTDICNFTNQYNSTLNNDLISGVLCANESSRQYVLAQGSIFSNINPESIWLDLTSKLRLE